MKIINDISSFENKGTVATVGFFDGVHKGHQFLIEQVKETAKQKGLQSLIVTFDQHPRMVLHQDFQPRLLNTLEEKISLIEKTGVDYCCVLPFTKKLSNLSSYQFLKDILSDKLHVKNLIIGHDHRFGHNREDSFVQYQEYGNEIGIEIAQMIPFVEDETVISSSVIRRLLEKGQVEKANHFLNYQFSISGTVVHGQQIGRTIHYPTANVVVDDAHKEIPSIGIYAVKVEYNGTIYKGMLSIGTRPTVDPKATKPTIEVNIFDFDKDIYSQKLKIIFVERVRNEVKFQNLSQLADQLRKDKELIQQILKD